MHLLDLIVPIFILYLIQKRIKFVLVHSVKTDKKLEDSDSLSVLPKEGGQWITYIIELFLRATKCCIDGKVCSFKSFENIVANWVTSMGIYYNETIGSTANLFNINSVPKLGSTMD